MGGLKNRIREWSGEFGFEACGFAEIKPLVCGMRFLSDWLDRGYAGDMAYMYDNLSKRYDPRELLPGARTMIMFLMNYYPRRWQPENQPEIAVYAYGRDYHYVVKERLRKIAERIDNHEYRVFCDSAPVLERYWAERAGLGWIGRSGMLINPKMGTYTFIGTLITTLELPGDSPMSNRCGRCRKCIEACPTKAIVNDAVLDARRCLSYQTIEKRGSVDESLLRIAGARLYGCDRCMQVCPWNRFAHPGDIEELAPVEGLFDLDWKKLTRGEFNRVLKYSPMQRAGYKKLRTRIDEIYSEEL